MRELLAAPTAMQGLLGYFHSSWAGRSQAETQLCCARRTTLWTHIRNLVRKGQVGRQVGRGLWELHWGRVPAAWMSAALAKAQFSRGEGPSDYCSSEGKGRVSPAKPAGFPF